MGIDVSEKHNASKLTHMLDIFHRLVSVKETQSSGSRLYFCDQVIVRNQLCSKQVAYFYLMAEIKSASETSCFFNQNETLEHVHHMCEVSNTPPSLLTVGPVTRIILQGITWDSSVGIATGYWLDGRGVGVRVAVGSRIVSSPLWGPPSLLSDGYGGSFHGG
jgi:hypothetical protein